MGGLGWRGLGVFWTVILVVVAMGAAALQSLGPVRTAAAPPPAGSVKPASAAAPPPAPAPPAVPAVAALQPGRTAAGPIADPDPALLEPARAGGGAMLPRLDMAGRGPMQEYARGFDRTTLRPRVGIILAGIGTSEAESQDAIRALPGGVTLAVSPYTIRPTRLLEAARIAGHEYLLSLPMESYGDAAGDAGDHALLAAATPAQNADRLDWALSRFAGYAGVTDALGRLRGERFAGNPDLFAPLLRQLSARGLFFVDARPGAVPPPGIWAADVDVVIDEPAVRSEIDAKLALLENLARQHGSALGLAGTPRPVTVDRIGDWANGLAAKGLVLAPASALVRMQADKPQAGKPAAITTGASK
jgi:polysaccharide deacetylase 2 family uncharacterized protein YibQ